MMGQAESSGLACHACTASNTFGRGFEQGERCRKQRPGLRAQPQMCQRIRPRDPGIDDGQLPAKPVRVATKAESRKHDE